MTHVVVLLVPTVACLLTALASSGVQRRMNPAAGALVLNCRVEGTDGVARLR